MKTQAPGFGAFFRARSLELDIADGNGTCRIDSPVRDHLLNPFGRLHGGIIATIMDMSMGHLIRHEMGVGGATLDMNVQYLRPITGPTAHCEGAFLKRGRNICFLESRMYNADADLAAVATSTWKPMPATKGASPPIGPR